MTNMAVKTTFPIRLPMTNMANTAVRPTLFAVPMAAISPGEMQSDCCKTDDMLSDCCKMLKPAPANPVPAVTFPV